MESMFAIELAFRSLTKTGVGLTNLPFGRRGRALSSRMTADRSHSVYVLVQEAMGRACRGHRAGRLGAGCAAPAVSEPASDAA